jgi:hypothetical protein
MTAQGAASDFKYITSAAVWGQLARFHSAQKRSPVRRCYHHIGVRPESIGRVLGVGLRVAGRMAGQRIMGEGQAQVNARAQPASADVKTRGRVAGQTTRGVAKGVGGFLRPFRNVGGKIWLEVTGVFFFLPVLVFSPILWRTRASWQQGVDHRTFVASAILVVVFFYLGVSSFWRAHRK